MIDVILRSKQKDAQQQQGELIRDIILPKSRMRSTAKKQIMIVDVYSNGS